MAQPVLQLEEVSKRFGRVVVADDLTIAVRRDEVLGVVGPNGAGKTSVFGLISGDLTPDSGRILFADKEVDRLGRRRAAAASASAAPTRFPARSSG